jgi:hypothetical protein
MDARVLKVLLKPLDEIKYSLIKIFGRTSIFSAFIPTRLAGLVP